MPDIDLTLPYVPPPKTTMSRQDFETNIADGSNIHGFIGAVRMLNSKLTDLVPADWPYAKKADNSAKNFSEYGIVISISETESLVVVGYRDENGNRKGHVDNTELRLWVSHFGVSEVLTKSEMKVLIPEDI